MGFGFFWAIFLLVATVILALWLVRILFPSTNEPSEPPAGSPNQFMANGDLHMYESNSTDQNRAVDRDQEREG